MPAGQSTIGTAEQMTLSVAKQLADIAGPRMGEYLQHLESRKAHLEALLRQSHQSDVSAMLAEVNAAIDALKQARTQVQDAAERAMRIEARL